jgi:hypothetical protein
MNKSVEDTIRALHRKARSHRLPMKAQVGLLGGRREEPVKVQIKRLDATRAAHS